MKYCIAPRCLAIIEKDSSQYGFCNRCWADLPSEKREIILRQEGWLPPDHPTTIVHVPSPRMRWAMLLALAMGLVGGFLSRFF